MRQKDDHYRLISIYTIVMLVLIGWGVSSLCDRCSCSPSKENDTISVRVDSVRDTTIIVVHDTVPKLVTEKVIKYVPVKEIIEDTSDDCSEPLDTVLPVVQKEYSDDSTYTCYISGVKYQEYPKLDSIDVKSKIITNTITKTITIQERKSRWGVSVTAGPTFDVINGKMGAGVSVGLSYTIFNF